jgi:metal-dependent amidase/aminoacylase/carboxypeptidase family protein
VATALSSLPLGRHYEGVLSVGAIQAGDAFNVIPDRALLRGTARAFNLDTELEIEALIRSSCQDIAVEAGVEIEVTWTRHCKITRNTPSMTEISREAAATTMGVDRILVDYRTMAGEDFGEILDVVGGTYALVGSGKADGSSFPHHSPFFDLEEEAILIARRLHTNVAQAYGEAMVRPPSSES